MKTHGFGSFYLSSSPAPTRLSYPLRNIDNGSGNGAPSSSEPNRRVLKKGRVQPKKRPPRGLKEGRRCSSVEPREVLEGAVFEVVFCRALGGRVGEVVFEDRCRHDAVAAARVRRATSLQQTSLRQECDERLAAARVRRDTHAMVKQHVGPPGACWNCSAAEDSKIKPGE